MKIFSVILPVRVTRLLFSEFLLTWLCFFTSCLLFVQGDAWNYLFDERGWLRIFLAVFSVSAGIFINNLYAKLQVESRVGLILKLSSVMGIALIVQGLLAYLPSGLALPRAVMIAGAVLSFAVLYSWRMVYSRFVLSNVGLQEIVFVGCDTTIEEIAERVRLRPELGYRIAGYVAGQPGEPKVRANPLLGSYLGDLHDVERVARSLNRCHLIVANAERQSEIPLPALLRLAHSGMPVEEAATAYETICGRVCSGQLRPYQIIFFNELPAKPGSVALQSIYTNLMALAAILVTAPILFVAACAVKLTSRGPLLEPDMRVGLHGIPFSLHRFRCHRVNRGAETREELITPVGRLLTTLNIVHWPRLFNLLRGEITLVGPRPERPEFVAELRRFFAFYDQRHSIKPGMTGWSQINTRAEAGRTDSLRQLEYDLYYTKHISLALDAYILLHGIRSVLPFARQSA